MNTKKKLIERNLKFSNKYYYQGITRGSVESGQVTCCDNCGKLITNMVSLLQKDINRTYTIGTDCADTILKAGCMYEGFAGGERTDYNFDIYGFNQCTRVATELNKGKSYTDKFIFIQVENDKGRIIEASKADMQKFYPELIK